MAGAKACARICPAGLIALTRVETMAPDHILTESLHNVHRICPVMAASARIQGGQLAMRVGEKMIRLTAPKTFLKRLFDWCQGDMSLADIEVASAREFRDAPFMDFIMAMMRAGVLIDAANLLAHTATHAHAKGQAVGSEIWPHIRTRLAPEEPSSDAGTTAHRLASPAATPLLATIAKRRSAGAFGSEPITAAQLSMLLHAAYGKCSDDHRHRPVASAGAFYRIDVHIVLFKAVGALQAALYKVEFDAAGAVRFKLQHADLKNLARTLHAPHQMQAASGLLILSADLALPALKYRSRAYPFVLMEAGGIIQNIALSAAEQNCGWRPIGGFDEAAVASLCQLPDGHNVLITGLFGTQQQSDTTGQTARLIPEFSWIANSAGAPFHMGMARITGKAAGETVYSWGRDTDAVRAYDKAVAEATERHAYHHYRDDLCRRARLGDFPRMCSPEKLLAYAPSQYKTASFPFARFDPARDYLWTAATSLTTGDRHWIPAELVFDRDCLPAAHGGKPLSLAMSSGCASGISIAHAQENALFELLERDAFLHHWLAQHGGHEITQATLPEAIQDRITRLTERACLVSVQLLYLGAEPTWLCIAQHEKNHFTAVGAGAGSSAAGAIESALAEVESAAYSRLSQPYTGKIAARDVLFPHDHSDLYASKRYFKKADALLQCDRQMSFEQARLLCSDSYHKLMHKLEQAGLEALWVDLSLADAPLTLAGNPIFSGRAFVAGLIPLTFGSARMPLAMDRYQLAAARFPHPFP